MVFSAVPSNWGICHLPEDVRFSIMESMGVDDCSEIEVASLRDQDAVSRAIEDRQAVERPCGYYPEGRYLLSAIGETLPVTLIVSGHLTGRTFTGERREIYSRLLSKHEFFILMSQIALGSPLTVALSLIGDAVVTPFDSIDGIDDGDGDWHPRAAYFASTALDRSYFMTRLVGDEYFFADDARCR